MKLEGWNARERVAIRWHSSTLRIRGILQSNSESMDVYINLFHSADIFAHSTRPPIYNMQGPIPVEPQPDNSPYNRLRSTTVLTVPQPPPPPPPQLRFNLSQDGYDHHTDAIDTNKKRIMAATKSQSKFLNAVRKSIDYHADVHISNNKPRSPPVVDPNDPNDPNGRRRARIRPSCGIGARALGTCPVSARGSTRGSASGRGTATL